MLPPIFCSRFSFSFPFFSLFFFALLFIFIFGGSLERITSSNANSIVTHIFSREIDADCENWRTNWKRREMERFSCFFARRPPIVAPSKYFRNSSDACRLRQDFRNTAMATRCKRWATKIANVFAVCVCTRQTRIGQRLFDENDGSQKAVNQSRRDPSYNVDYGRFVVSNARLLVFLVYLASNITAIDRTRLSFIHEPGHGRFKSRMSTFVDHFGHR